jgi:thioredoxin 1
MTASRKGKGPIVLTDATFESFVRDHPSAIVDCWAAWCFPCRALSPVIDQLSEEHTGIAFGKLNVDENPETPMKFGIMAIPTLLYFRDGKLADRTMGALPKEALENRLVSLFKAR